VLALLLVLLLLLLPAAAAGSGQHSPCGAAGACARRPAVLPPALTAQCDQRAGSSCTAQPPPPVGCARLPAVLLPAALPPSPAAGNRQTPAMPPGGRPGRAACGWLGACVEGWAEQEDAARVR
jgi:hypothetical protein